MWLGLGTCSIPVHRRASKQLQSSQRGSGTVFSKVRFDRQVKLPLSQFHPVRRIAVHCWPNDWDKRIPLISLPQSCQRIKWMRKRTNWIQMPQLIWIVFLWEEKEWLYTGRMVGQYNQSITILGDSIRERDTVTNHSIGMKDCYREFGTLRPAKEEYFGFVSNILQEPFRLTHIANFPHLISIIGSFNWHSIITSVGDWWPVT